MDILDGFEELTVANHHNQIKISILHVELSLKVRYFLNNNGVGYIGLLINNVTGKGLRGSIEAAAARSYVGRTIFVFLSELENGKKLITVPALFEKDPAFDGRVDLNCLDIKTYYHDDFKKTAVEVYKEHRNALIGKRLCENRESLCKGILELPDRGLEILRSYK